MYIKTSRCLPAQCAGKHLSKLWGRHVGLLSCKRLCMRMWGGVVGNGLPSLLAVCSDGLYGVEGGGFVAVVMYANWIGPPMLVVCRFNIVSTGGMFCCYVFVGAFFREVVCLLLLLFLKNYAFVFVQNRKSLRRRPRHQLCFMVYVLMFILLGHYSRRHQWMLWFCRMSWSVCFIKNSWSMSVVTLCRPSTVNQVDQSWGHVCKSSTERAGKCTLESLLLLPPACPARTNPCKIRWLQDVACKGKQKRWVSVTDDRAYACIIS
jgi:hypothetical protein